MRNASPAAVVFDLDGVLIDSEALQYQAYSLVLERFDVRISMAEYATHWIATGRGPEYAVDAYHLPVTPAELRAAKQPVYHDILHGAVSTMPGAGAAVQRLHPYFPLAVATNSGRKDVSYVLDRLGLARFFQTVVTREDYPDAKPAPDAYRTAAARLGVAPSRCLVVEDAQRGVLAARAAGALPIAVPHAFTQENDFSLAARVLPSLDALTAELVWELLGERE